MKRDSAQHGSAQHNSTPQSPRYQSPAPSMVMGILPGSPPPIAQIKEGETALSRENAVPENVLPDGPSRSPVSVGPRHEEPLFRFVQINDLHVQSIDSALPKVNGYPAANEKARWVIESIDQDILCPLPAFVVGIGDMIHGESLERLAADLKLFQEIIRPLRCPFYPVVGNHEMIQQEHSPRHLEAYIEAFGADRVNYTFTAYGILFVVLNNGGGDNPENGRGRRQWLQQVLRAHAEQPKILLCHIPLIPLREELVLAQSFGFSSYIDLDSGMLPLVEDYSDSVIAVLSGHLHLTGMKMRQGIVHLSLSGTASYPCDGAVVYEVFPDHIVVTVKAIPPDLAQASPTIHGRPRFEHDFTDVDHLTVQEYQEGLASERYFVIELPPAKRPAHPTQVL